MPALGDALWKLNPRVMIRNPVMFVVEVVATLTTILFIRDLVTGGHGLGFSFQINLWLWFTVYFANFAEAVAEGRGKAQAAALRQTKTDAVAKVLDKGATQPRSIPATALKQGDIVLVEAGDLVPSDGDVIEGVASVNEAAITGESAPVIRESRRRPFGRHRRHDRHLRLDQGAHHGRARPTFLDRMIALVEGAERQKTPNEIALNILLAGMTIVFVFAVATIPSFAAYAGGHVTVLVLVALFVTLIPTTIGALLSAIGIAGMDRLVSFNVLAMSGRAVEAAGDVDTLLLDKTGTITLGNRQATEFLPLPGVSEQELADAAQLASLSDETPEGRSIVVLAKDKYGIRGRDMAPLQANFIPFSAQTRISGVDFEGVSIRKGAVDAVAMSQATATHDVPSRASSNAIAEQIAQPGGTPLAVPKDGSLLGVIHLKDIVKGGIRERFAELRTHGYPHRDDHGRQSADRGRHCRRIRRRRFPGAGHAGDEAQADPRRAGQGQAGRHVRRRHQRCACAGAGRCRRRDEHGHAWRRAKPATWSISTAIRPSSSRSWRSASNCLSRAVR